MAKVTIFHNPHCNSSVHAVRTAEELGVDAEVVLYMKTPPDAATLNAIIDKLEDPPTSLVRRDSLFAKLGLTEDDVQTREQIVDLLVKRKALLQRPIVVTESKAIVGRPKERIRALLGGSA
jgi:arsenate reductase